MSQSLLISVEKLSAPIEDLCLERRAFHMLRRGDIQTISQIIVAGKTNVLSIRNIGVRVQDIVNSFRHEFYLVEGSGHRELDQVAERCVHSGFRRATVSEMSYTQFLSKR